MTRKRFIKLCMSIGISRNDARELADLGFLTSYKDYLEIVKDVYRMHPYLFNRNYPLKRLI